jgi:hypothetical protein
MPYFGDTPVIDLSSVSFLLESADPDLPNVLVDSENKFITVVGLLKHRSDEHRRFLRKIAEMKGTDVAEREVEGDELRKVAGPEIIGSLRSLTDDLYNAVDAARAANETSFDRLSLQIREQFPGERHLSRTFDPKVIGRPIARPSGGQSRDR